MTYDYADTFGLILTLVALIGMIVVGGCFMFVIVDHHSRKHTQSKFSVPASTRPTYLIVLDDD